MRRQTIGVGVAGLLAAMAGVAAYAAGASPQSAAAVPQSSDGALSRELLDRYCVTCHNQRMKTAGLVLDQVRLDEIGTHAPVLEKVVRKLRSGQMPPEGRPRPDAATLESFVVALEQALDREAARAPNPGRVASRRLNRVEYVNAIQDLLGLEVDGAELLPSDMAGFGFDNNADVLSITPALMARYSAAATKISRAAVGSPDNRPIQQVYSLGFEQQDARMSEDMPFATHGGLAVRHVFPLDGEYAFAIRLKGSEAGGGGIVGIEDEHEIELRLDHGLVKRFTIGGQFKGPDPGVLIPIPEDDIEGQQIHEYRLNADKALEVRVPVKAGSRLVAVAFTDSTFSPLEGAYGRPGIDKLSISGPFNGKVPVETTTRQRIFTCRPTAPRDEEACARKILSGLGRRAYRRPVTERDIERLLVVYREGRRDRDFEAGIERALEALLSMPQFLLRIEQEPAGVGTNRAYRLTDLELASRLSFFLWRSIPDDELLDVAARGQLRDEATLARQVRRMLADRRATRFMNDFVGQWLQVRNIHGQAPDGALFAGFNDTLRKAMVRETELFFESQVRADQPIQELLRANYTYLNEQLARHYRVNGVYGSRFRRVTWPDDRRHGLLGHASVLTVTSYANRTSVVLRGKWVLENLLGTPPPPPPPNVPPLKASDAANPTSLRERMQQHRANPVCASCHTKMDPLGFAMENFDAIGRWRETDGGAPINAAITMDGAAVDSMRAFREALLSRGDAFVHTVTEKLLTYALGRGVEYFDAPTVRKLVRDLEQDKYRWSSLVLGIVRSEPFQMRRVQGVERAGQVAAAGEPR
jgi:mono/diheme cytochrome c family protein